MLAATALATTPPFYSIIVFWLALSMSALSFVLFGYLVVCEVLARQNQLDRAVRHMESLPNAGELAAKFAKSGPAASALACSILFLLIGAMIGLSLDHMWDGLKAIQSAGG